MYHPKKRHRRRYLQWQHILKLLLKVTPPALQFYDFVLLQFKKPSTAEVHTDVDQTGGHACKMDNNIFGDYAVALSYSFIFGSSLSLFCLQKAAIYWAPVANCELFMAAVDLAVFAGTKRCPVPLGQQ